MPRLQEKSTLGPLPVPGCPPASLAGPRPRAQLQCFVRQKGWASLPAALSWRPLSGVALGVLLLLASPAWPARGRCAVAGMACSAAARYTARACERDAGRLADATEIATRRAACRSERAAAAAACRAIADPCAVACRTAPSCTESVRGCRRTARRAYGECRARCHGRRDLRCLVACDEERGRAEGGCGFVAAWPAAGAAELPALPSGRPADLTALLDAAELAVIAEADARAETLRRRDLRLWVGGPGATVTVTQLRHGFPFGFPMDLRELGDPADLEFYGHIAREHATLMVAETSLKWKNAEPEPGHFAFETADAELAWAERLGFAVKGHTLLWGNAPPFSTGSGVPVWLRERFPNPTLTAAQRRELVALVRRQVETIVGRYRGRIAIWDVTNETLNVFTQWFIARLGPGIVSDMFRWVRAIDPGAQLVFNEWITEVFTGLPGPDAAAVRDRVLALRAAGVPIDAVGQQAHFVPGLAYAGATVDLSQRTRIDDYAAALDTLAETGLPIHLTEINVIAPAEPEARAAQLEALMRLWWGHSAVEQVVFWGLWNTVAARNHFEHGLWDDTGNLSRHGEAVVSLLNDRWRTRATLVADATGAVALRATLGDYVATWEEDGRPVHVRFRLERAAGPATIAVVPLPGEPWPGA